MIRPGLLLVLLAVLLASGCQTTEKSTLDQPLVARLFLETAAGAPGLTVQLPVSKAVIGVNPKPVLVETDILHASYAKVELGWCLYLELTPAAVRDLQRMSAANPNQRLVLTLNNLPVGARRIDRPAPDGGLLIFVELPDEELPPVAERIKRTSEKLVKKGR
jgi:hypothetical protein